MIFKKMAHFWNKECALFLLLSLLEGIEGGREKLCKGKIKLYVDIKGEKSNAFK